LGFALSWALVIFLWRGHYAHYRALLFVLLTICAAWYFFIYQTVIEKQSTLSSEEVKLQVVVEEFPRHYEKVTVIPARTVDDREEDLDLLFFVPFVADYGEVLKIEGELKRNHWPERSIFYVSVADRLGQKSASSLRDYLVRVRGTLVDNVSQILPGDHGAFIAGITLGAREGVSPTLREAMKSSGTTHLTVLSGYNVLLVVLVIRRLLEKRISRKKRFYFISLGLVIFLMLVALEPSVTRAGIMAWLILLGEYWGRLIHFGYIALLTAVLMSFLDPSLISYSISFQLSFLSLLGIAYLAPLFKRLLLPVLKTKIQQPFIVALYETTAAQIMVWPLLSFYFGEVYLTSLLANMLILPLMPFLMMLGIFLACISLFSLKLAGLYAILIIPFTTYVLGIIYFFSHFILALPGEVHQKLLVLIYICLGLIIFPRLLQGNHEYEK